MSEFVPFSLKSCSEPTPRAVSTPQAPLARHLVDFNAKPPPPAPIHTPTDDELDIPATQTSPLVSLPQDEIEALTQAAFEAGRSEGATAARLAAEASFSSALTEMALDEENERARNALLAERAGELFAQTVIDVVGALTRLPPDVLRGMHRDLVQDAIDLITGYGSEVTVSCTASDEALIRSALAYPDKISFTPCAVPEESRIRISTETNMVVLDPDEWRRRAVEKVLASVTSLSRPDTKTRKMADGL
ncbi:hypothetical protein [Asaia sp. VD9]|uniref:hypothetical protein n=1 Tax=Asaia sp. VD9 TaxID=3081235 RepID=UPI0030180D4E